MWLELGEKSPDLCLKMGIRKIIYKILDTIKVLMWFPYMVFRVIIAVTVIYQLDRLGININPIVMGVIAMSYAAYPILDFLVGVNEEDRTEKLFEEVVRNTIKTEVKKRG